MQLCDKASARQPQAGFFLLDSSYGVKKWEACYLLLHLAPVSHILVPHYSWSSQPRTEILRAGKIPEGKGQSAARGAEQVQGEEKEGGAE